MNWINPTAPASGDNGHLAQRQSRKPTERAWIRCTLERMKDRGDLARREQYSLVALAARNL